MDLKVRNFDLKDLNQVLEIEKASFPRDAYPKCLFKEFYISYPEEFFVAEVSDKVVGYILGYIFNDTGEIVSIAVKPEFRNSGVGKKLMETILSLFKEKNLKRCILQVRVSNKIAIEFYEKLGFKVIKREKGYYIDEDAYIMEKNLL
ncbi:MAG TPA: ribosomal protein S18-alanine N-acetyltransferase [Dictyoglomaceae bacterium]|nr:ribosomal protein S18-alanine N-acetyltransferase [Dictyoglomaceae bacterium]